MSENDRTGPSVSVVMATYNRPAFLDIALKCFAAQTWAKRELIVVDDGDRCPADRIAVEQAGARLLRVDHGTPLGTKLNIAASTATGDLLCKWDDDDWYGPMFLQVLTMVFTASGTSRRAVAFLQPFWFLLLDRWQIRRSDAGRCSGATLTLPHYLWRENPFRAIPREVDAWFLLDLLKLGVETVPVEREDIFFQVRHKTHLWTHMPDGTPLHTYLESCFLLPDGPEQYLPPWAVDAYRKISEVVPCRA